MSWKYTIGLLYGGFVLLIMIMVGIAYTGKVHLVDKNYYQKEVNYQKTIDARNRGLRYQYAIQMKQDTEKIYFEYPEHLQKEEVEVLGYCLSDASKDFRGSLQMPIAKNILRKGPYKLTVHWGKEPLDTLVELSIFIE